MAQVHGGRLVSKALAVREAEERTEDLGPALDAAFRSGRPACVNVKIAKSDFRKGAISV